MAWKGEANTRSVRQITLLPAQRLQYQALEDLGKDPVSFSVLVHWQELDLIWSKRDEMRTAGHPSTLARTVYTSMDGLMD